MPETLPVNKFGGPAIRLGNVIVPPSGLTADLTLSADGSEIIGFNADAATYTVTLPTAAECAGQIRQIVNIGSNKFAVAGYTGGPIDIEQRGTPTGGSNSKVWSATFACDGSSWFITDWAISA